MADERPTPAAGGGVVVRDVGNQRARHCRTSSRDHGSNTADSKYRPNPRPMAPLLFPLSSTSADELRRTAGRLADWVAAQGSDVALSDLAYTLARRRAHRPVRTAVIAEQPRRS